LAADTAATISIQVAACAANSAAVALSAVERRLSGRAVPATTYCDPS